jgi:serine/threonine-protein kinase
MNDAERELVGRTLAGRFRLTGYIGAGAMASVYRGEQDGEPRDVAVKVMHPELLRDAMFAKRFTREAKTASRIEHRNTVRIVDHGTDGDLLYLAMELCVGEDLFDVLARERRLPEARAAKVAIQICAALSAAHAYGVVHRDLKPENVMICKDPGDPAADLVKVLDFGIAKSLERERPEAAPSSSGEPFSAPPSSVLTMVGTLVGTPEYMSPEQSLGLPVDARSDVYATGVLLFQILTGRVPFTGSSPVEIMMQHNDKPPPAPSSLAPGLHAGLERIVLRALAKPPEHRFQSAAELAEALTSLLPDLAPSLRRESVRPPAGSLPPLSGPALPGVPSVVAITSDDAPRVSPVPAEGPPDTLRSSAVAASAGRAAADHPLATTLASSAEAAPAAKGARVVVTEALATTLAEGADLSAVAAARARVEAEAKKPAPEATQATPPAPEAAAEAVTPAPEAVIPKPAPRPRPLARAAPEPEAHDVVPAWVYAVVTTVLLGILLLVRYLRFR